MTRHWVYLDRYSAEPQRVEVLAWHEGKAVVVAVEEGLLSLARPSLVSFTDLTSVVEDNMQTPVQR